MAQHFLGGRGVLGVLKVSISLFYLLLYIQVVIFLREEPS